MDHNNACDPAFIPQDYAFYVQRYSSQYLHGRIEQCSQIWLNMYHDFHEVSTILGNPEDLISKILDPTKLLFLVEIPRLVFAYRFFTTKELQQLCMAHHIIYSKKSKSQMAFELMYHNCALTSCRPLVYIFKVLSTPRKINGIAPPVHVRSENAHNSSQHDLVGDHSDWSHLEPFSREQKFALLSQWERETSTDALRSVVCAACAIRMPERGSSWVHSTSVDLLLLTNPNLPEHIHPQTYDFQLYRKALLNWKGLERLDILGNMRICAPCLKSLRKGCMPKFSLANNLYYGHDCLPPTVKDAFDKSTVFDRVLVSRARCNNICCKFFRKGSFTPDEDEDLSQAAPRGSSYAHGGIRGNVMVLPLDTVRMSNVIPPSPSTLRDTMCAVFVGSTLPTREALRERKVTPILARKSRVRTMIDFLLTNNPHYRPEYNFQFSERNLNEIFRGIEDEGVPALVQIVKVSSSDAIIASTSDYTPRSNDLCSWDGRTDDLLMENVGYTDGDESPINYLTMKALALERCLLGKPFIAYGSGTTPLSDFCDPCILDWLFPHLDPWGVGGFFDPNRRIRLGLEEQVRHMLKMDDHIFQQDPQFSFVFFNVIQKMNIARNLQFRVPYQTHKRIARELHTVKADLLVDLNRKCERDPSYKPQSDDELSVFNLLSSITMVARHTPGSNGYKVMLRSQIQALINFKGPPTVFITLNPSDVENPIVHLYAGHDISLEDIHNGQDMTSWQRMLFASKHPAACALFFDLMITKFISVVLKYGCQETGLFGRCEAYYGTVEAQGKGTLHCHMLLWLKGHLPPHQLYEEMSKSDDYRKRVFCWLESIIKCEFPVTGEHFPGSQPLSRCRHTDVGNPHPGTLPAPSPSAYGDRVNNYWEEYDCFLSQLLHAYNWHVHNATCWKYLAVGEKRTNQNCRLRMDGVTRQTTTLDLETGGILLRRHHPKIASYNDCVTVMMKSNSELKFIGSGTAARDMVFYITDYVTKPSLPVHVGVSALMYAVEKTNRLDLGDNITDERALRAVTIAVNSMMGRQEISQPQVMSYLLGGGDHYTSHQYSVLHWGLVLLFVDSEYRESIESAEDNSVVGSAEEPTSVATVPLQLKVGSIAACNQYFDYVFRNEEPDFEALCLYDFVGRCTKHVFPSVTSSDRPQSGAFSSWDHPQRASHGLRLRKTFYVPVLLGPQIPNPNRSDEIKERWAKYMLILFKPWRNPLDLKGNHDSWLAAFEANEDDLSVKHGAIIRNMNTFSDSSDARSSRLRSRTGMSKSRFPPDSVDASNNEMQSSSCDFDDFFVYNMGFDANIFSFHDDENSDESTLEKQIASVIGSQVLAHLELCLPVIAESCLPRSSELAMLKVNTTDSTRLSELSAIMQLKRKRGTTLEVQETSRPNKRRRTARDCAPFVRLMTVLDGTLSSDPGVQAGICSAVIQEMNLESNPEQLRAFNIVADHLFTGSDEQLLLYVSGVGGTGKSHVIKSIVMLFERLERRRELVLGAPTGIAAVLIGGQTLHSLIKSNPSGRHASVAALIDIWSGIRYLILDEVSMVGAQFLSQLSTAIKQGRGSSTSQANLEKPFGGLNIIFMGDFGQLKPPKQHPLYSHKIINSPAFSISTNVNGISATNGVILWRQVATVVELVRNQRHAEDLEYGEFLLRLREGKCIRAVKPGDRDDFSYLRTRLLSELVRQPHELISFWDAPIIVGNKALRDALNSKMIHYHARRLDQQIFVFHARDFWKRASVPEGIKNHLWNLPSKQNHDAFGFLPLFKGMKVMVTENIAFDNGIVNGSEGVVQSVEYDEDEQGRKYAVVVYVHIPKCGVHVSGLDENVVPIFPVSTRIEYSAPFDTDISAFVRRQIPLVPAYAYMDFKAQGRTVDKVYADIVSAKGQGVYVMLSRVKQLQGLIIL